MTPRCVPSTVDHAVDDDDDDLGDIQFWARPRSRIYHTIVSIIKSPGVGIAKQNTVGREE
jgi:hypothetical protein